MTIFTISICPIMMLSGTVTLGVLVGGVPVMVGVLVSVVVLVQVGVEVQTPPLQGVGVAVRVEVAVLVDVRVRVGVGVQDGLQGVTVGVCVLVWVGVEV